MAAATARLTSEACIPLLERCRTSKRYDLGTLSMSARVPYPRCRTQSLVCRLMPHVPPAPRPLGPDAEGQWVRRWTSPAWTQTVDAWVGDRLAERHRRIVGQPVTYRARFWSVVRCYPTAEGRVWVKETNPGHGFEAGLTADVARLAPNAVVRPLAVDRDRGWLLTDDHGTTLSHTDVADQSTRCSVVRGLARVQCSLLGRLDINEQPGLIVLAPSAAGGRVRTLARQWATLPQGHPLRVEQDLVERARRAAAVLDRYSASLSDAIPLDLDFNDVYAANVFADRSSGRLRLRFFDFGNAIWGHPFVSLHGFLDSVVEWTGAPLSRADRDQLGESYLAVWSEHLGTEVQVLRDDIAATAALVCVHRLFSWLRLVPYADTIELHSRAEIPRKWLAQVAALAD